MEKISGTIRRVFGAMALLPLVFAVWYDQIIGGLVLSCLSLLMGLEIKRLVNMPPVHGFLVIGLITTQSTPHWLIERPSEIIYGLALLASALVFAHMKKFMVTLFIFLLSVCLGYATLLLSKPSGHLMLVTLAAIVAACDIAAYFFGRRIGGPKLWRQVSPNKTISGSIGGLVAAIVVTLFLADVFGVDIERDALILGSGLGILAQAGDLLESAVKRQLNVKDSGSILPGHGGLLDRFDGYILVVPAIYLYLFGI